MTPNCNTDLREGEDSIEREFSPSALGQVIQSEGEKKKKQMLFFGSRAI